MASVITHIFDLGTRWSGNWLLNCIVAKPKKGVARAEGKAEERARREQRAKQKKVDERLHGLISVGKNQKFFFLWQNPKYPLFFICAVLLVRRKISPGG